MTIALSISKCFVVCKTIRDENRSRYTEVLNMVRTLAKMFEVLWKVWICIGCDTLSLMPLEAFGRVGAEFLARSAANCKSYSWC
jgi:hypothetical protein